MLSYADRLKGKQDIAFHLLCLISSVSKTPPLCITYVSALQNQRFSSIKQGLVDKFTYNSYLA